MAFLARHETVAALEKELVFCTINVRVFFSLSSYKQIHTTAAMKKRILLSIALTINSILFCYGSITFQVEELSKPEEYLSTCRYYELYEKLTLSDIYASKQRIKGNNIKIIAKSDAPDRLVFFGYHSFFDGMYNAYADHRPFVLSPDMIWLLICQGFAQHVNANAEELRHHFVSFPGKTTLVVADSVVNLNSPADEWEKVFPEFTRQIGENTGKELIDILTADFSTTTPVEKVASEITIMEAMKSYFEFVKIYTTCGIPEITLEGTPDDWQKALDKARKLAKYNLGWWINELEPLLEEFVKASQGKVDTEFWRNMFKYHSEIRYGTPTIIDGWIVKFFPYDKNAKRNNLKELIGSNSLPEEIVKVDLKYIDLNPNGQTVETPLELWAGFIGLHQNMDNYTLTPVIGWMIGKKNVNSLGLQQSFETTSDSGIHIRVKELPEAILKLEKIKRLKVEFIDTIIIPDTLANVKIEYLTLSGKTTDSEIERIKSMFPDSKLIVINGNLVVGQEEEFIFYR